MADQLRDTTYLFGTNSIYVEQAYERYLQDPSSVDASWQALFKDMGEEIENVLKNRQGASWAPRDLKVIGAKAPAEETKKTAPKGVLSEQNCADSINALMLIRAYKVRGHLLSDLDPLKLVGGKMHPDLDPKTYGFTESDYDRKIYTGGAFGPDYTTLRELLTALQKTYSSRVAVEFMHIPSLEKREWIAKRMEEVQGNPVSDAKEKQNILEDMIEFEEFEQFLHTKFPGAKRFSAEGGEAAFAAMERMIESAAAQNVEEIIIGMPHRGRLNVLTKIMGRRYAAMISEFQGNQIHISEDIDASGDVKYHQGASSDRNIEGHTLHLSLCANPSHLEAVNPVVAGRVRAKQDQRGDEVERKRVLGILLHGDAAFAGQGVVPETMGLSDLKGYTTGGVVHIIVNNQIGFTTSPKSARNSPYPSDLAKGAHAPIFHVNGDDPEAVVFASKLAIEYRQKFGTDVVVDVICYRRYGHNEGDEPFFTQPIMYKAISNHPTPMEVYARRLQAEGAVSAEKYAQMRKDFVDFLGKEYEVAQDFKGGPADWLSGEWEGLTHEHVIAHVDTGVDLAHLKKLGNALGSYPESHNVHRKLVRQLEAKKKMMESGEGLDWAMGEALAYASLLAEGHRVRLSGQDAVRGTFSHRHSGLVDQETEKRYFPLNNLGVEQGHFEVIDSNLSEFAVLGFEYGYSITAPNSLVLWEAQFGDFANGAQVMIDQFISSSESKWLRLSGLVMLLPHGYEGQGPEHSSARLERYLQLCAEDNMQVVNCTTPANFFHVLRRQLHRNFRKPLIVMTPKSLLRHRRCISSLEDFKPGTGFKHVIEEQEKNLVAADKVKRVVICSGKVYYDLLEERESQNITDVVLVRLEQYYPFPAQELAKALKPYKNAEVVWCQEEPENMGAWHFIDRRLESVLADLGGKAVRPSYVGRPAAASPAAGYGKIHKRELEAFLQDAFSVSGTATKKKN